MLNPLLPMVSIVTPSFNQAAFIRETIESVLSQSYPNIEHIVIDGSSSDGTVAILQEYSYRCGHRFRYVSEPDRGQSHAINKGLQLAQGQIIGWLNSDDTYLPGAVEKAVHVLQANPHLGMVYGRGNYTDESNRFLKPYHVEPYQSQRLFECCIVCQPASFVRKEVYDSLGGIDEQLQFCMDYDMWMRISKHYPIGYMDELLANSRMHSSCKTVVGYTEVGLPEILTASMKNYGTVSNNYLCQLIIHFFKNGLLWWAELVKKYPLFGHYPRIADTNGYEDGWAPPNYRATIETTPDQPCKRLLCHGTYQRIHGDLHLTVHVNGIPVKKVTVADGNFYIDLRIDAVSTRTSIDISADQHFVPAARGGSNDARQLSFRINLIAPLSQQEYEFFHHLKKGADVANRWVLANRHPVPML